MTPTHAPIDPKRVDVAIVIHNGTLIRIAAKDVKGLADNASVLKES